MSAGKLPGQETHRGGLALAGFADHHPCLLRVRRQDVAQTATGEGGWARISFGHVAFQIEVDVDRLQRARVALEQGCEAAVLLAHPGAVTTHSSRTALRRLNRSQPQLPEQVGGIGEHGIVAVLAVLPCPTPQLLVRQQGHRDPVGLGVQHGQRATLGGFIEDGLAGGHHGGRKAMGGQVHVLCAKGLHPEPLGAQAGHECVGGTGGGRQIEHDHIASRVVLPAAEARLPRRRSAHPLAELACDPGHRAAKIDVQIGVPARIADLHKPIGRQQGVLEDRVVALWVGHA